MAGKSKKPARNTKSVDEWISEIDTLVSEQRNIVFQIGDKLVAAEEELTKKDFAKLVKTCALKSKQTVNNYMRVARAVHLREPSVANHLPTGVGALIDLAAWSEKEVEAAITNKIIHPQSERRILKNWIYEFRMKSMGHDVWKPPKKATDRIVGFIMCSEDDAGAALVYLNKNLSELSTKLLPNGMFISTSDLESYVIGDEKRVWADRVLGAYKSHRELFIDPNFCEFMDKYREHESGIAITWSITPEIANLIATNDHAKLHKVLKLRKSDWAAVGVTSTDKATLLTLFE